MRVGWLSQRSFLHRFSIEYSAVVGIHKPFEEGATHPAEGLVYLPLAIRMPAPARKIERRSRSRNHTYQTPNRISAQAHIV